MPFQRKSRVWCTLSKANNSKSEFWILTVCDNEALAVKYDQEIHHLASWFWRILKAAIAHSAMTFQLLSEALIREPKSRIWSRFWPSFSLTKYFLYPILILAKKPEHSLYFFVQFFGYSQRHACRGERACECVREHERVNHLYAQLSA